MVQIVLNGEPREVADGETVLALIQSLEIDPARVAVEFNRNILKADRWPETALHAGAQVEIVHFVGGG